jgi:heterodisulfide reductase subunit A
VVFDTKIRNKFYQFFSLNVFFLKKQILIKRWFMAEQVLGSVLVLGGGIAGMQAALDAANSGYYVYLVEKNPSIGGVMSQLDKTFPTNDCAM